jgi:hypothetical protein
MKCFAGLLIVVGLFSGCASSISVTDGVHKRAFIPCANDELCFRNTYGVARDNSCSDFPVTYKNNDKEYNTSNREWVYPLGYAHM